MHLMDFQNALLFMCCFHVEVFDKCGDVRSMNPVRDEYRFSLVKLFHLFTLRTSIYFTVLYHIASRAANNSMR